VTSKRTTKSRRAKPRVGRPMLGRVARQLLTLRVDADLLDEIKRRADERGVGYQTLMHEYLTTGARRDGVGALAKDGAL